MEEAILNFFNFVNDPLGICLIVLLAISGIWFTIATKGVQFRMFGEMCKLIVENDSPTEGKHISPFQAFAVSLASRVGTGNLAGVEIGRAHV